MIDPNSKDIQWTKKASQEMALVSMIDSLYRGDLIEEYIERLDSLQPFPHYRDLYDQNKDLLNSIVEIFFPYPVFTPSNINKSGTGEFYLFLTINSIFYMEWYRRLEEEEYRGYKKKKAEMEAARLILSCYADVKLLNKLINFPLHINEAIQQLEEEIFVARGRRQQGEKVIECIKKHFKIKKVTSTEYKRMIDGNKKFYEKLKRDHGFTDEEIKKIPIFGQLKTKI